MTETITGGPGPRHAFAPHSDPIEGALYRIHVVFEESDGRLWAAGTDMMAPTLESADTFADRLNEALGLDRAAWAARATRAFAPGGAREDGSDCPLWNSGTGSMAPGSRDLAPPTLP